MPSAVTTACTCRIRARPRRASFIEVACNAHARRKFYEARGSDALRAHQALAYYRQLYELERAAKEFSDEQRLQMRQDLAVPILGQFRQWLEARRPEVLPKSPMGEAIRYALNNWAALLRYTEASFLAIDNNVAEREMKRVAIGRKNWLTVGSPRGGQTAAVLFSFTSTCQRLGVEPWAYLRDVLTRLPTTPAGQLGDLLPNHWQAARQVSRPTPPMSTSEKPPPAAQPASYPWPPSPHLGQGATRRGAIAGVKCNRHVLGSGRTQVERRNSHGAVAARRAGLSLS
jgi:hypothetical protein